MTIKQAIKILIRTNKWRRGAEIEMPNPKEFGEAIDIAISIMEVTLVEQPGLKRYHIKPKALYKSKYYGRTYSKIKS